MRAEHVGHLAAKVAAVTVDKLLNDIVVGHLDDGGQVCESLLVNLLVVNRVDIGQVAIAVGFEMHLRVVEVHEAVELLCHGSRQFDVFLFALVVGDFHRLLLVDLCEGGGGAAHHEQGNP